MARQYDVNANQVFAWRKLYGATAEGLPEPGMVPVTVMPDPPVAPSPRPSAGMIEIELPGGYWESSLRFWKALEEVFLATRH